MIHMGPQHLMQMVASTLEQALEDQAGTRSPEEEALVALEDLVAHKVQEAFRADFKT
jgi:hypothetical protein